MVSQRPCLSLVKACGTTFWPLSRQTPGIRLTVEPAPNAATNSDSGETVSQSSVRSIAPLIAATQRLASAVLQLGKTCCKLLPNCKQCSTAWNAHFRFWACDRPQRPPKRKNEHG